MFFNSIFFIKGTRYSISTRITRSQKETGRTKVLKYFSMRWCWQISWTHRQLTLSQALGKSLKAIDVRRWLDIILDILQHLQSQDNWSMCNCQGCGVQIWRPRFEYRRFKPQCCPYPQMLTLSKSANVIPYLWECVYHNLLQTNQWIKKNKDKLN